PAIGTVMRADRLAHRKARGEISRFSALARRKRDFDGDLATLRRDLIEAERDMPCAGLNRPRHVTRSRLRQADGELAAGAAAPATEAIGEEIDAARIENADVYGVAISQARIRANLVTVGILYIDAG